MKNEIGILSLDALRPADLIGKTIFIRSDFNVPLLPHKGYYRVADDTRIRRFLDLTFKKIHELTDGKCRVIIGSHLGRPHKTKDYTGWDGIFNMQFVCSHFDTLIRERYGDAYTIFPPEIIDSQLKNSLEIFLYNRFPLGGIKFLPNLRYLLDPANPDAYRLEFIEQLANVADVYINCAFGCSHRTTKSIRMLPQVMRKENKLVVAGNLLYEEIQKLGHFGRRAIANPKKTIVVAGGAKVADKINILKQFVQTQIKSIFIGGKMVNAFLLAKDRFSDGMPLVAENLPKKLLSLDADKNKELLNEIKSAAEIMAMAEENKVEIILPVDYKVAANFEDPTFIIKDKPDFDEELQLDLGPKTIEMFTETILHENIRNIVWNGPLGAYDHPHCPSYAEGSLELAKLLFGSAIRKMELYVVIGGGDSAAILNKISMDEMKRIIKEKIKEQFSETINQELISVDFKKSDCFTLWNYFTSNFFISTGGGASLEFLEKFLKYNGQNDMASYLPGTSTLMELCSLK
ncbi:MAG: phosphoglycerate kinase [Candidatus Nitrohelix vancouverensis]|uniref:Phosphoglycerate kinase n=1 Tax=Candidatus Nitrohelix vancouverensis TaxID=2705534 RepID=A0A7T0C3R2_9BACT|nr:MAG: phosphoglycerate kinase [Candidatus Nitrohelix vancouverensis]